MIFSLEFFLHFDVCNRARFADKRVFYDLKTRILKQYGKLIRYELQIFEKTWCWQCEDAVNFVQMQVCHEKHLCGGDPISLHKHILGVYQLECEDGKGREYHVPTNEFRYDNYANPRYDKRSERFDELMALVTQKTSLMKLDDLSITGQTAQDSLAWLTVWAEKYFNQGSIVYETRLYYTPEKDKRKHYNRVRSQNRVIFGISADGKTGQWVFCRRWQTVKGMMSGPKYNWPESVRRPVTSPTEIMYSIAEEDWKELVEKAKNP